MLKLFLIIFITKTLFALSPFSLEGIKEVNLKVIDKSKFTKKQNLNKIKNDLKYTLENLGIKTKSDKFTNFILKIQGSKIKDNYMIHISMFIVEDCYPSRNRTVENMCITYYKDDIFNSDENNIQNDIYESTIKYLLSDLLAQHKEENN